METGYRMKTTSRRDYLQKIYQRYRGAGKKRSNRFWTSSAQIVVTTANTLSACWERRRKPSRPGEDPGRRQVSHGAQVISILEAVWEAADYPWSMPAEGSAARVAIV